jgi:hypothetical protein
MSIDSDQRPAWQPVVELLLVGAAGALLTVLAGCVMSAHVAFGSWWMLPVALVFGVLAADFTSGLVHWFGDSFFREESPVVGPMLIAPFREHHRDPQAITRHSLLELHGNSCVPLVAAAGLAVAVMPDLEARVWRMFYAWLFFFALMAVATNQCHVWAHRSHVPRFVRALQRRGLILTVAGHQRHHSGGFRQSYCITTGWLNPGLDAVDLFPRLERLARAAKLGALRLLRSAGT